LIPGAIVISQNIWLASVLVAVVACGRTDIKGGSGAQPAPQAQTPSKDSDGTKQNKKTDDKDKDKDEKKDADGDKTLGGITGGDTRPDDNDASTSTGSDGRADDETPQNNVPVSTSTSTSQSSDPNVVVFRIPAGTGRGAWNTPDKPIVAKVGQTLEIHNDDSIQHWVHAGFGQFMTHAFSGINPGQSARYQIGNTNADIHDHNTNGAIYMQISNKQ
jgi:hypothetical protein